MEHDTLSPEEAPSRRRLVRTPDDHVIAGVCGGLGRHFDLDPVIFRIAFVVLTIAGGSGVLLYVLAWLVVPEAGRRTSVGTAMMGRAAHGQALGVALLVIAAIVIVGNLFDGGLGAAVLLMAAGVALLAWKRDDGDDDRDDALEDEDDLDGVTSSGFVVYRDETSSATAARRPRRPRSHLGRLTVGVILLVAGGFAAGHASGAFDAALESFLATALLITGAALVVGARFGRARGLIVLGIVLVVLTAGASFFDVPLRGGVGERLYQPVSLAEIRDEYRLLAGELVIDLTRVEDFGEGEVHIDASVAAGELRVLLPRRLDADVRAEAAGGEVNLFGIARDGVNVEAEQVDDTDGAAGVVLRLEVGGGRVEVRRAAA